MAWVYSRRSFCCWKRKPSLHSQQRSGNIATNRQATQGWPEIRSQYSSFWWNFFGGMPWIFVSCKMWVPWLQFYASVAAKFFFSHNIQGLFLISSCNRWMRSCSVKLKKNLKTVLLPGWVVYLVVGPVGVVCLTQLIEMGWSTMKSLPMTSHSLGHSRTMLCRTKQNSSRSSHSGCSWHISRCLKESCKWYNL